MLNNLPITQQKKDCFATHSCKDVKKNNLFFDEYKVKSFLECANQKFFTSQVTNKTYCIRFILSQPKLFKLEYSLNCSIQYLDNI